MKALAYAFAQSNVQIMEINLHDTQLFTEASRSHFARCLYGTTVQEAAFSLTEELGVREIK